MDTYWLKDDLATILIQHVLILVENILELLMVYLLDNFFLTLNNYLFLIEYLLVLRKWFLKIIMKSTVKMHKFGRFFQNWNFLKKRFFNFLPPRQNFLEGEDFLMVCLDFFWDLEEQNQWNLRPDINGVFSHSKKCRLYLAPKINFWDSRNLKILKSRKTMHKT